MTKTITLSDAYDEKLAQLVTRPFDETRESVIQKLIDDALARTLKVRSGKNGNHGRDDGAIDVNPDAHESLAFARLKSASLNGRHLLRPKWNALMNRVHVMGLKQLGSLDALKRVTGARLKAGRHEGEGFRYLREGGFSIQGLDANLAWDNSLAVARAIGVPIQVTFEWRDKPGAAHPGKTGAMSWNPPAP